MWLWMLGNMVMEAGQCGYGGWAMWLWMLGSVAMDVEQCGGGG